MNYIYRVSKCLSSFSGLGLQNVNKPKMYYIFNSALYLTDIGSILIFHGIILNSISNDQKITRSKNSNKKKTRILISFRNKLGWERYYKNWKNRHPNIKMAKKHCKSMISSFLNQYLKLILYLPNVIFHLQIHTRFSVASFTYSYHLYMHSTVKALNTLELPC